jgi:hypothetical protein
MERASVDRIYALAVIVRRRELVAHPRLLGTAPVPGTTTSVLAHPDTLRSVYVLCSDTA